MTISLITYNSPSYHQMVNLRLEVLRTPLGLKFTHEQLQEDENNVLIGAFENDQVVGCCLLSPLSNNTIQLRQMAVHPSLQGKGVGRKIVEFAENWANENHFQELILHARSTAVPFYENLGYKKDGNPFIEVTIEHYNMTKNLS